MNTKKHILSCIALILLFSFSTEAQVGFRVGTTISSFYYTDAELDPQLGYDIDLRPLLGYDIEWLQLGNQKPVFSPLIGVYYNWQFAQRFALRSGMNFTQKGGSFSQNEYERINYKVKINYLEIPLLVALKFINKEKLHVELYLGGFAALNLHAYKKVSTENSNAEKAQLKNVSNADAGIQFGFDFKKKLKKGYLVFDIGAVIGLKDIYKSNTNDPALYHAIQKIKTTGFVINMGYEF